MYFHITKLCLYLQANMLLNEQLFVPSVYVIVLCISLLFVLLKTFKWTANLLEKY